MTTGKTIRNMLSRLFGIKENGVGTEGLSLRSDVLPPISDVVDIMSASSGLVYRAIIEADGADGGTVVSEHNPFGLAVSVQPALDAGICFLILQKDKPLWEIDENTVCISRVWDSNNPVADFWVNWPYSFAITSTTNAPNNGGITVSIMSQDLSSPGSGEGVPLPAGYLFGIEIYM